MNSRQYWEHRMAELEALTDRRCRLTASEVAKLYDSALERMTGRIQKIFTRFAEGYSLTPAEAKELLSAAETREARQVLQDTFDACTDAAEREKLRARLDAPAYAYRISRLEALRDQVYADAVVIGAEEVRYDEARLTDVYEQSYYHTTFALSQEQGENVPFSKLTDRQAAAALNAYWSPGTAAVAKNYSQRVWGNTELLAQEVQNTVTRGIMTGERYEDIERELEASMGGVSWGKQVQPDGSTRSVLSGRGAKYRAARLVRTEGNYLSGQGTMESFRDAGIERYIFRALLETRTCRTCGELDGKDFPVSEQQPGTNMHPMHPQCRCFTVPYRDKETLSKRTRAAQLGADQWGEVPQDMTYREWYGKYVEGNPAMQASEKAVRNKAADRQQWQEYRSVLGKNAPKTLDAFQDLKYNEPEKWMLAKLDYSRQKDLREHPEKALPHAETVEAADAKFTKYFFNPDNPKGSAKGAAFTSRLGYDQTNWQDMQAEIRRRAPKYPAALKNSDQYGDRYEQNMVLYGPKGTPANVTVGWISKPDGTVSMTTAHVKEVK